MKKIAFEIPYPRDKAKFLRTYSLNSYYAGKHWSQRKREMDAWHWTVKSALNRAGIRREILGEPVAIAFFWDDGLDIDNHAILGKAAVDALKGSLLANDGPKYFRRVTHDFWRGGCIRVEIAEVTG